MRPTSTPSSTNSATSSSSRSTAWAAAASSASRAEDPNRNVIVETLTGFGARSIMAQRYLPAISHGDKRILLIAGEPVPYCLARIPKAGESRGNLAAGGKGVAHAR
jgi:glutathione synthase/RimK-type ligase-like ATP-grasp enzyme